uniref:Rho guanine nucleotide exchange factor 17 n=1 Tax=Sinocyclocheilus grahami TaxID=75366 RepID=A0A672PLM0_SINGR
MCTLMYNYKLDMRKPECTADLFSAANVSAFSSQFSKEILANIYSAYIDNFMNAKDAVRIAKEAKPAFLKFLEQNMRENKEKQALGDLMIKPVQRIPRYELLVKDLLKHTPEDHPDYLFLQDAQKNIKRLAERINKGRRTAEELERETRVMQEIEAHIEGVEHILNPQRTFLRQEMVVEAKTVGGKKDRSLFLFSDLLICTTLKRKSGSLRRSSMSLYSAASVIDTSSKYKFLWKLPLEDIEVVKGSSNQATNRENIQKTISRLDEDLSTLGQISKLSETLSFPHQSLDDVIKDLMASVHRELADKQSLAFSMTLLPTKLELTSTSAETTFIFEFSSPDTRSNFEQAFEEAKKKLGKSDIYICMCVCVCVCVCVIHVYQSSDNIRNRKNSMKMQHSASILCILYLDNKVFVSLANGEVIVYQREAGSFWDPQSSQTLCLGSPSGPVTKMVPVAGKLWCGCQNRVLIINTSTLAQEHSLQVGQDSGRCVTSMVSYGKGVWIALQGSAQVRLYHTSTYESLTEVDVAPAVHKMLAGSDAIIRQHKAACLRITALLACKDLLWIGTSAGVVLTLAIPPVSSTGLGSLRAPLLPMGSAHGHTGHVRFLTCIELPEGFDVNFPPPSESGKFLTRRDSAQRRASIILPVKSNLLVISGGDGYEDFRLTNSSETMGRDDSTNHLLLWRV